MRDFPTRTASLATRLCSATSHLIPTLHLQGACWYVMLDFAKLASALPFGGAFSLCIWAVL